MSEIDTASDSASGTASEDWSARATSTIVGYVDTIRNATTGKALLASRLAPYGVAAALVAMVVLILLLILVFRFLVIVTGYWDYVGTGGVWLAYLILGLVFMTAGGVLWKKRSSA